MSNYIKIDRKILEWEWWGDINTSRLFLYMLLKANWKAGKFQGKGIPRGSFVSSLPKLSEETGLTIREVRTAISHLKSTGEVTVKSFNKYSIFTVKNYCQYQSSDMQNDRQATGNRHSNDILTTTIEERKNDRMEEYNPPISPLTRMQDFLEAYPGKANAYQVGIAYADLVKSGLVTEDDLVMAAGNYADECRRNGTESRYIKRAENFLKETMFDYYLPGKYTSPKDDEKRGGEPEGGYYGIRAGETYL